MVGDSELINIPHQALDSYYVVDTQSVGDLVVKISIFG